MRSHEVVIIENQFGPTDHRHLGQLLTYAGGTDPATVVWVAESFRDEHRAALDWLNQRTDSTTRFFGVQLAAVTLEGAPAGLVAPLFEVVVKPNDWGKRVKHTAVDAPTDRERQYVEFWTRWLDRVAAHGWTNRKAPPRHFVYLPSGSNSARYVVSFHSAGLRSELFLHHEDPAVNQARWQSLADQRDTIEKVFGAPLIFDDLPHRKGCRVGVERKNHEAVDDLESWEEYLQWFEDSQVKLRAAIAAVGGIPPVPEASLDDEPSSLEEEDTAI